MDNQQRKEKYATPLVIKHDILKEMTGFQRYHNHSYGDKTPSYTRYIRRWWS